MPGLQQRVLGREQLTIASAYTTGSTTALTACSSRRLSCSRNRDGGHVEKAVQLYSHQASRHNAKSTSGDSRTHQRVKLEQ